MTKRKKGGRGSSGRKNNNLSSPNPGRWILKKFLDFVACKIINNIEKKKEESKTNKDDENEILEKRIYILQRTRLGSDFCEYCDLEFKLGCEKIEKLRMLTSEKITLLNAVYVTSNFKTKMSFLSTYQLVKCMFVLYAVTVN